MRSLVPGIALLPLLAAAQSTPVALDSCPGYTATNVHQSGSTLTADLTLAGPACNAYGPDVTNLKLQVEYEDNARIHVKITDAKSKRYEVPESVVPRPKSNHASPSKAAIQFKYKASPFSFSIVRRSNPSQVLFDTSSHPIVFEPQYLRVKTDLPPNPNVYGLGESTESLRLNPDNTTRTLWSRDAYSIPQNSNLYGNHPVYFEHRQNGGTHGVFLLNSNGMDIKLAKDGSNGGNTLEYNAIGGILDFYFFSGPTPIEAAKQYAQIVGTPAEIPYWGLGFHQCRYGYKDYLDVASVVDNYAKANIPLETMWTDIDYMYKRWIFTLDPDYFPLDKMREVISRLHSRNQHYIMMVDPAVGYQPGQNYGTFDRGEKARIFLKNADGTDHKGIVWPGVAVWPDWFDPKTQGFWNDEFQRFFNPQTGVDIDGVWIDMNEPASFCNAPCTNPEEQAQQQGLPPKRPNPAPAPGTPIPPWGPLTKRDYQYNYISPPYSIHNAANTLSDRTAGTNAVQFGNLMQYDTHNLYGSMMSFATRDAMLSRRPGKKPLVITRSTFAGAGSKTGLWLGDNISDWEHYRWSISGMLSMASIFQLPMVGSDVCGFGGNTTVELCARWAMLGAFNPFYRNHNADDAKSQEFYSWPEVAEAARNAITTRYKLLDYFYTSLHAASVDGTPSLNPVFFLYPNDPATYTIEFQFFYGSSILVSPVHDQGATSVDIYLPKDIFYDFYTYTPVQGNGKTTLTGISITEIPVHIRGGSVVPLRVESAMTTTDLRKKDFELVIAPGVDGSASGSLFVDDGDSINSKSTSLSFRYARNELDVRGSFDYKTGVSVSKLSFLGQSGAKKVHVNGVKVDDKNVKYDATTKVLTVSTTIPLTRGFTVELV
jgi:alpha-glucosidase